MNWCNKEGLEFSFSFSFWQFSQKNCIPSIYRKYPPRLSTVSPKNQNSVHKENKCVIFSASCNGGKTDRTELNAAGGVRFGKELTRVSRKYHASRCLQRDNANHSSFQTERKFVECLSFRRLSQTSTSMFQSSIRAMSSRLFTQFDKRLMTFSVS